MTYGFVIGLLIAAWLVVVAALELRIVRRRELGQLDDDELDLVTGAAAVELQASELGRRALAKLVLELDRRGRL